MIGKLKVHIDLATGRDHTYIAIRDSNGKVVRLVKVDYETRGMLSVRDKELVKVASHKVNL